MLSDIEIAQAAECKNIQAIADAVGISSEYLYPYGRNKAKIDNKQTISDQSKKGKLVIVTAITPTPAGEGKTTVLIGLADALRRLNQNASIAMREPSLGPCFGVKGGACGGGYSQVIPMEDINLHFTGDLHAITTAHNLLSAMLDNHIHHGNLLDIDIRTITWPRVMDMNDRALRHIVIGLGGKSNGIPRESSFEITTASEVMALFCLALDFEDLKKRLGAIIVAKNKLGEPVTARDLKADGAMTSLLKDAFDPNLVQSIEGTPAFIHGGPFANIAHGCNSLVATNMALSLSDWVVTEGGFGSDLGCEKFLDIKCRIGGLVPHAVVLVATIKALKMHGGVVLADVKIPNPDAVKSGFANLEKHVENIRSFGLEPFVAINKFAFDSDEEIEVLRKLCLERDIKLSLSTVWADGGAGALELAEMIINHKPSDEFRFAYELTDDIEDKIRKVVQNIYGAADINISADAKKEIAHIKDWGLSDLPICIAKTQYSLSDNPKLLGRPKDFVVHIRNLKVCAGAGFIVVYAGNIMTKPGLPKHPAACNISVDRTGKISGLF